MKDQLELVDSLVLEEVLEVLEVEVQEVLVMHLIFLNNYLKDLELVQVEEEVILLLDLMVDQNYQEVILKLH